MASERLKVNPGDIEAIHMMAEVEQKTKSWVESRVIPGKFTGSLKLKPIDHKAGFQAWAKKNMFRNLAPVMSGFGMKLMRKMGWEMGKPLGKEGVGHTAPIPLDLKLDRSGLSTKGDPPALKKKPMIPQKAPAASSSSSSQRPVFQPAVAHVKEGEVMQGPSLSVAPPNTIHLVQGKHPICVLQEIAAKKRWGNPAYRMVECEGPDHLKTFIFEVTVPLGTFRPANTSKNKKTARMDAALAALQALGVVPKQ